MWTLEVRVVVYMQVSRIQILRTVSFWKGFIKCQYGDEKRRGWLTRSCALVRIVCSLLESGGANVLGRSIQNSAWEGEKAMLGNGGGYKELFASGL